MNGQLAPASQPRNGLSVTSLVLGILGLVACGLLSGIPAIITGHMAHSRARKSPELYGGAEMAIAGFVMGYVSIVTTVFLAGLFAALLLPALAKAKGQAQTVACVSNLKQVSLAARIWSNEHNEKLPPDFLTMSNELATPKILVCPSDAGKTKAADWSQFSERENASYEYLTPGLAESEDGNTVVFRCPIHGNVARLDGSVISGPRNRRTQSDR